MIPKIFHLTSKEAVLPQHFQKNVDIIQDLYPDYEILIHSDDDIIRFMQDKFPQFYEDVVTRMPKFIMVVDTVRYMWMYIYGGVYCDMDILFKKRYDFKSGVVFLRREWTYPEDNSIDDSVHNCIFASEAGHDVWLDLLKGIQENVNALYGNGASTKGVVNFPLFRRVLVKLRLMKPKYPDVFSVTGPNAISKSITDGKLLNKYSDINVLPCSCIYQPGMSSSSPDVASFVHETSASWVEQK